MKHKNRYTTPQLWAEAISKLHGDDTHLPIVKKKVDPYAVKDPMLDDEEWEDSLGDEDEDESDEVIFAPDLENPNESYVVWSKDYFGESIYPESDETLRRIRHLKKVNPEGYEEVRGLLYHTMEKYNLIEDLWQMMDECKDINPRLVAEIKCKLEHMDIDGEDADRLLETYRYQKGMLDLFDDLGIECEV